MPATSRSRRPAQDSSRARSRMGPALLFVIASALAGLVILGMATGTDQQTDKGFTPLWQVILVQVVGVVSLIALGGLIGACAGRWNGRRAQTLRGGAGVRDLAPVGGAA